MTAPPRPSRAAAGESAPSMSPWGRFGPLLYFGFALLLVVVVLPTALRPPEPPPTGSAAFDPDEPPDDQVLITELGRGSSGTAGAGFGGVGTGSGAGTGAARPSRRSRACPFGFGHPPRQTESLYAAPCAPAFSGSNGGATSRGVSANEVRVAVTLGTGVSSNYTGPVPFTPQGRENNGGRTFRVYQTYFNQRFQFYGRTMRLYIADGNPQAAEYDPFGGVFFGDRGDFADAAARGWIAFGYVADEFPGTFLMSRRPYAWAWPMDTTRSARLGADFICKQLWGRRAVHAGDPTGTFQSSTRKFGLVYSSDDVYSVTKDEFARFLHEGCGGRFEETIGIATLAGQAQIATAVTRLRAAGVTTVAFIMSSRGWFASAPMTHSASGQGYFPEWLVTNSALAYNLQARAHNQDQWQHAFGLSHGEISTPPEHADAYIAYKSVDPDNEPDNAVATRIFGSLLQVANALQVAGPTLTPEAVEAGLHRMPKRPSDPVWSIGGGFAADDHSYADDAAIIWWDRTAADAEGTPGAYRFVLGGRRFAPGEIPAGDLGLFREGITSASRQD